MSNIKKVLILWRSTSFPHNGSFFTRIHKDDDTVTEGYISSERLKVKIQSNRIDKFKNFNKGLLIAILEDQVIEINKKFNKLKYELIQNEPQGNTFISLLL